MAGAILDFLPGACPNCGKKIKWGKFGADDFFGGLKHTCGCGCGLEYRRGLIRRPFELQAAGLCEYCGLNPAIWIDDTVHGVCGDCVTLAHGKLVPR